VLLCCAQTNQCHMGCGWVRCSPNYLIRKCQTFKWLRHPDSFMNLCSMRRKRCCCCTLQLLLHRQMCQWIVNHNTKGCNQLSVNWDQLESKHGVYGRSFLSNRWDPHGLMSHRDDHKLWFFHLQMYWIVPGTFFKVPPRSRFQARWADIRNGV